MSDEKTPAPPAIPPPPKPMKGAKMLPLVGVRFEIDTPFFRACAEAIQAGRTTMVVVDAIPDPERETYRLTIAQAPPDPVPEVIPETGDPVS